MLSICYSNSNRFSLKKSLDDQIKQLAELKNNDAPKFKSIFWTGENIILHSQRGELMRLRTFIESNITVLIPFQI